MVSLPYIDDEIARMDAGGAPPAYLRHFHWGHYDDLDGFDDSAEGYVSAAETMTERVVAAGRVADDRRILDVGCGFGGTLDLIRGRNPGCRLAGINIDERQLSWARRLLGAGAAAIPFVTADGCVLPVRDASIDHVLAVECVFHFPSRKRFFREVARVLQPGGTLALSDFVLATGSAASVALNVRSAGLGEWYGRSATPLTSVAYERLGRSVGLELLVDDDVTERTLPTYPALRRLYKESGAVDGVTTVDSVEQLARSGGWEYHVLAFRKPAEPEAGGDG